MNRLQKIAWYQLIVILTALGLGGVVTLVVFNKGGEYSKLALLPLLVLAFVNFDRMFFPLKAGEIALDERDESIKKKAVTTAYTIFWFAFIAGCIVPFILLDGTGSVPIIVLPVMVLCAAVLVRLVWSVMVLIQYERGGKREKS